MKTKIAFIFFLAITVRLIALWLERLMGIGLYFHPDSSYYIERGSELFSQEWIEILSTMVYNEFYVFLAGISQLLFSSSIPLVILNIIVGALVPVEIAKFLNEFELSSSRQFYAGLFFALLPYHIHLSIHPLKDILFLYFALLSLRLLLQKKNVRFVISSSLMCFNRLYLGSITFLSYLFLSSLRRFRFLIVLALIVLLITPLGNRFIETIFERRELVIAGRDFFTGIEMVRYDTRLQLFLYGLLSPIRQIFIPNIIQARSSLEVMFSFHMLFYQTLMAMYLWNFMNNLKQYSLFKIWMSSQQGVKWASLIVIYFGLSVIIDITTPAIGPLVRYREMPLMFVALSFFIMPPHIKKTTIMNLRKEFA